MNYILSARGMNRRDGEVHLVKEAIQGDYYWRLPGGQVNNDETLPEAVRREVLEELGVEVSSVDESPVGAFSFESFYADDMELINVVFDVDYPVEELRQKERVVETRWVSAEALKNGNSSVSSGMIQGFEDFCRNTL